MSERRSNVWELVVNLGREVRPALRSIPARAGEPGGTPWPIRACKVYPCVLGFT